MSPGFAGIKEMGIYKFAEFYVSQLPITCLVYDNRGFGDSDTPAGQPKGEIVPMMQCSDISDAITFVSTKEEVDPERIGVWGSSYSGGHALYVGAVDRRVKVVIGQVPCTSGWDTFDRMSSPDALKALGAAFSQGTVYLQPASAAQILTKRQIAWVGRGVGVRSPSQWWNRMLQSLRLYLRLTVTNTSASGLIIHDGKTKLLSSRTCLTPS
jgi:pimeloyl-ACP methyl ester carboxylesterase